MRALSSLQIRVIYESRRHLSEKKSCMKLVMYGGVVAQVERSENRGGERTSGLALGCGRHVCGKVIYDSAAETNARHLCMRLCHLWHDVRYLAGDLIYEHASSCIQPRHLWRARSSMRGRPASARRLNDGGRPSDLHWPGSSRRSAANLPETRRRSTAKPICAQIGSPRHQSVPFRPRSTSTKSSGARPWDAERTADMHMLHAYRRARAPLSRSDAAAFPARASRFLRCTTHPGSPRD